MNNEWFKIDETPLPENRRIRLYYEKYGQLYGTWDGHKVTIENPFLPMDGPPMPPTYWQHIE